MTLAEQYLSKGIQQSFTEGKKETKAEIAKKLLQKIFDITVIAQVTGLDSETIKNLK